MTAAAINATAIATDEARSKVSAYVKEITAGADVEGDITFEVSRFGVGGSGPLGEIDFVFGQNVTEVVEELVDIAVSEALELVGSGKAKVKFTLKSIRNGKPLVRKETFTLVLPENEDEDEDFLEELPTSKGALAQTMRHQEKIVRATIGPQQKIVEYLLRDNREAREQIGVMMRQGMEQWKMFQELVDAKFARDLEFKRFENEERRRDQVSGMLIQGAPVLLNKLLGGGKTISEPATRTEQMLEGLLSTFKPEQFQKLMISGQIELDPAQRAALAEIAMTFVERREAEAARAAGAANGIANGDANAPKH